MLTQIEEFLFGGNIAHDLIALEKTDKCWIMAISPIGNFN